MWALNEITLEKFTENEILLSKKISICVVDIYVLILVLSLYFVQYSVYFLYKYMIS